MNLQKSIDIMVAYIYLQGETNRGCFVPEDYYERSLRRYNFVYRIN